MGPHDTLSTVDRITLPEDFDERWPGGSRGATEAFMNLVRSSEAGLANVARLLRPFDLSPAGGLVLSALADHGPLSPSDLSARLIVTRATMTGLLDSLERRGHLRRIPNPDDRRGLLIEITDGGRTVADDLRRVIHAAETGWLSTLKPSEQRTLVRLLHKLQDGIAGSRE
jgi:MarR family transcriptional regulator, transcriptional regulator for hemolysin